MVGKISILCISKHSLIHLTLELYSHHKIHCHLTSLALMVIDHPGLRALATSSTLHHFRLIITGLDREESGGLVAGLSLLPRIWHVGHMNFIVLMDPLFLLFPARIFWSLFQADRCYTKALNSRTDILQQNAFILSHDRLIWSLMVTPVEVGDIPHCWDTLQNSIFQYPCSPTRCCNFEVPAQNWISVIALHQEYFLRMEATHQVLLGRATWRRSVIIQLKNPALIGKLVNE